MTTMMIRLLTVRFSRNRSTWLLSVTPTDDLKKPDVIAGGVDAARHGRLFGRTTTSNTRPSGLHASTGSYRIDEPTTEFPVFNKKPAGPSVIAALVKSIIDDMLLNTC
jgi:hypothetical protein